MSERFVRRLVLRQAALASLDRDGFVRRVEPKVAYFIADAAVAGLNTGDLGHFEGELKGGAVAVAVVAFERSSRHGE